MRSSKGFETGMICSGGWWNTGSSLFPPCAAPLSDFMWSSSSLNNMEKQVDQMQRHEASYSRSDDSDDHHSSSAECFPVMSSDYSQSFQDVQTHQMDDLGASVWFPNSLVHESSNQEFFKQFEAPNKVSQLGLGSGYPEMLQNQGETDTEMDYTFDNNFVTSYWPKLLSPKTNHGSRHSSNSNRAAPFWDSWMGGEEMGAPESHQPLVPLFLEDQKPYRKDVAPLIRHESTLGTKRKNAIDEVYKRPRIETPSSMPTFKVRKEKLGDRITALQQLVSPFGKTDTASVLHEAVEYIKFLHDQVLRTPYMQNGITTTQRKQVQGESENTQEGLKQDLRSRGLCLVPISSTFPLANETTSDFWTPSFGGTMAFK